MRVYELAKELGVESKVLAEVAGVKTMSGLDDEQVAALRFRFTPQKPQPVFDQGMPWHEVREGDIRRIVQAGAYFTYAEQKGPYDHKISQNRLKPTPQFVEWFE